MSLELPPLEAASALAPEYYTREDIYAFELREILGRSWHLLAGAEALAQPGAVIAREIAGVPVIVLRTEAGELRGYYNICPHRAGRMI